MLEVCRVKYWESCNSQSIGSALLRESLIMNFAKNTIIMIMIMIMTFFCISTKDKMALHHPELK